IAALFLASCGSQAEVTLVSSKPYEKEAFIAGDDYYSQELHGPYQLFDIGDFELEDGGKIRNCKLAYATFGRLSPQRDSAILILTECLPSPFETIHCTT